ncbi:MAG: type II secretion system F family protein [bacterium]|nr:type II secretion system F family protein [bacterium]
MKFHYIASQPDGKVVEGDLDALNASVVLDYLKQKGLRPVSVKALRVYIVRSAKFFGEAVTLSDKIFLARYLSLMLKAGTDLFHALEVLIADFEKPALKALLIEIKENLEKGNPFFTTFASYPRYFPPVFVNLLKAGEASGNLEMVLNTLSVSMDKERDLKGKIKSAMIYPLILLVMSFSTLMLLITFALPRIANVFSASNFTPPLFSRIVFAIGLFLNANALIIFPLLFAIAIGGWYFFTKVYIGRKMIHSFASRVFILRNVFDKFALQRFCSTLSSLIGAGLPILESLEITADAVGSDKFGEAIRNISRKGIAQGLTIGDAFRREAVFPAVITNLISISERAGHIDEVLKTLSEFYESEIDGAIKTTLAFLEPGLLLFVGLLIGSIAISVIVPLYQLVGGVGSL